MSDDRLREMREAFDRIFASPPPRAAAARESFLAVRLGGDRYALRLTELSGLERRMRIAPLTGGTPGLLGLAGMKARVVPVFSLAALLGYGEDRDAWSWLAVCRTPGAGEPVGLALEEVEGLIPAAPSDLHPAAAGRGRGDHVVEVLRSGPDGAPPRSVVDLNSVLAALGARAGAAHERSDGR